MTTRAVIYGVKSSPAEKESVADQHRQVLAAIPDDRVMAGAAMRRRRGRCG
jgi:DNA-binding GntR family transcriptional regulator